MSDLPKSSSEVVIPHLEQPGVGASINYVELVRFLIGPFLEAPSSLRVNCETSHQHNRVLIRLAIEGEDKGKIFGRGGRNIQAVRTVLQAIAQSVQQKVHLEVFGGEAERGSDDRSSQEKPKSQRTPPKRPSRRPPQADPNSSS